MKFPRSYLSRPTITHKDEEGAEVTLVCKVPINPTIMQWKNVTYVVHWYADGRHVYTEPQFCKPTNESAGANDQPCPGKNEIRSYLRGVGTNYYPGQWVSNFVWVIISVLHALFIVTFKNKNDLCRIMTSSKCKVNNRCGRNRRLRHFISKSILTLGLKKIIIAGDKRSPQS